jgi:hypothetical protein
MLTHAAYVDAGLYEGVPPFAAEKICEAMGVSPEHLREHAGRCAEGIEAARQKQAAEAERRKALADGEDLVRRLTGG